MNDYIINYATKYHINDDVQLVVDTYLYDELNDDAKFLYYHASVNENNRLSRNYELNENLTKNMVAVVIAHAKIVKNSKLVFNDIGSVCMIESTPFSDVYRVLSRYYSVYPEELKSLGSMKFRRFTDQSILNDMLIGKENYESIFSPRSTFFTRNFKSGKGSLDRTLKTVGNTFWKKCPTVKMYRGVPQYIYYYGDDSFLNEMEDYEY